MQKDFHYSVVKILAVKAGFEEDDAQTIAHASQYTDDATTHFPVRVTNPPDFIREHPRYRRNKQTFDPVCTAHKLFGLAEGIREEVQKEVYVSFHFVPAKDFSGLNSIRHKHYVTKANGELANELVGEAVNEVKNSSREERTRKLIKLGLVLHSYADTWSHQGFSGIHSPFNDIRELKRKKGNDWDLSWYGYRPDIGHAEADHCPDATHLEWKYQYDETNNTVNAKTHRKNFEIFEEAAQNLFRYLCEANNEASSDVLWDGFKDDLAYCLKKPTQDSGEFKKDAFNQKFQDIELYYDEDIWKNNALNNKDHKWFYFHVEAYNQRQRITCM